MGIAITSGFDSGNIECLACAAPDDIRLAIRRDNESAFLQWFHFRLTGARGVPCTLRIVNAGEAAYPDGWRDYRAVVSEDRATWRRVDTSYDGSTLEIRHTPAADSIYFAYFAPYSMERHADLVARALASPLCRHELLGRTLDGQDLDLLTVGTAGPGKRGCWIIARQHPGETMAEWWMEGCLERLLDPADPVARALLAKAVLHLVPNMNPDGSRRGHLRTNAAGANLNREWETPSLERSPEVALVRARMERSGVDFCLDVHGDEALPYVFLAGAAGIPSWNERLARLDAAFRTALLRASPDYQTTHGYPADAPGKANMTMCTSWVAERFGCLALTLEQPFKDNADAPDPLEGWSPARSRKLGAATLGALLEVMNELR